MVRLNLGARCGMNAHLATEPGYYADGRFGVRIENIVIVKDAKTPNNFGEKGYLCFEHVTMVSAPINCVSML